jgi:hypothetical protein
MPARTILPTVLLSFNLSISCVFLVSDRNPIDANDCNLKRYYCWNDIMVETEARIMQAGRADVDVLWPQEGANRKT